MIPIRVVKQGINLKTRYFHLSIISIPIFSCHANFLNKVVVHKYKKTVGRQQYGFEIHKFDQGTWTRLHNIPLARTGDQAWRAGNLIYGSLCSLHVWYSSHLSRYHLIALCEVTYWFMSCRVYTLSRRGISDLAGRGAAIAGPYFPSSWSDTVLSWSRYRITRELRH